MKLKFLPSLLFVLLFSNANAQQWKSYDWFNNPPQPSPVISELAFQGDTTWIGTVEYGLGWSIDDTTWNVIDTANSDLPDNHIGALAFDRNGILWIGAGTNAVKYDGTTFTIYNNANTPLLSPTSSATSIAVDPDNNVWFAFPFAGVGKFDGSSWTMFNAANDGLPTDWVRSIASDSSGNIWIATGSGAAMFNGTTWTTYNEDNTTLNEDFFMEVKVDSANIVWFGQDEGVAKYDGATWTEWDEDVVPGFEEDAVNGITFDAAGNVWVVMMLNGILKFDGLTWTNYTMANTTPTLPSNEFLVALTNACSNDVYFGSNSGLAIYNDTLTAECTSDTAVVTSVNALMGNDFSIASLHNPFESGLVELLCNVTDAGEYEIAVTNVLGRAVYVSKLPLQTGTTRISVQATSNGVYFATLSNRVSTVTTKLIVK